MTEAAVSFAGNLTDDPEVRHTEGGIARATFRVAVSDRREQERSFFTVVAWRDQAEHASQSLTKGSRVEVVAEELGASLRGRRQPPPGRRGAKASSQLARCDERDAARASVPLRSVRLGRPDQAQAYLPGSLIRRAVPTRSGVLVSRTSADQPSSASLAASSRGL
jgi:hypothetical protein